MVLSTSCSWTRPPQHVWTIDEVKNGNIIATYSLNNIIQTQTSKNGGFPSITFGRIADDPSIVDIVTAHESCSRQHARIAFDCRGTPWLRDLGSGNGTFVNEKRLPPEACGKDLYELNTTTSSSNRKGSRGVVLYPGDAIRFGASTRLYILEGPEEFERGASKHGMMCDEVKLGGRVASSSESHSETTTSSPSQHQQCDGEGEPTENSGCSWGMTADDFPHTDDGEQRVQRDTGDLPPLPSIDSFFFSSSGKYHIPNNLHQLHSQYNTRMHKLQSIQTESQRILQKENAGVELTDGQSRQLGKNQERISTLEKEVATLKEKIEDGIFAVIHGKERGTKRTREEDHQYNAEDEDDDCFYDRTASASKRRQNENAATVESEASLIQKWKSLLQGHAKQRMLMIRAQERCMGLEKLIDNADDDSDDIFFLKNDLTLANDNLSKANKEVVKTEKELDECEYLLKTVNDKLIWDRKAGLIGTNLLIKGEATLVESDAKHASSQLVAEDDSSKTMLSPPTTSVASAPSAWNMPPPPPIETCRSSTPGEDVGATEPQKTKKIIGPSRPPAQGTLAVLKKASLAPLPNRRALKTAESPMTSHPLEKQKDEWKAPIDQDGSGRTALHDKFKGRY